MAVKLINIEDVPIASINENPKIEVKITIKNTPPPMPKSPEANPTEIPITAEEIRLNGIFASSFSLFLSRIFLTATNNNKHPNIISKALDGSPDATKPPTALPIIPNMPNFNPGFTIPSNDFECLNAVGTMIAKLVPIDMSIARPGSTPMYFNKKYCRGTIKNPPPTPKSPDAKPAKTPIKIKPKKYSIGNISIKILYAYDILLLSLEVIILSRSELLYNQLHRQIPIKNT